MENRKFHPSDSVVVKHADGGESSGVVIRALEHPDHYLVFYIGKGGWQSGHRHASDLIPFDGATFLCTTPYNPAPSEALTEAAD